MSTTTPGCSFCFQAVRTELQRAETWYACTECGRLHHQRCWELVASCAICGSTQYKTASPPVLSQRRALLRTRALPITPTGVVYVSRDGTATAPRTRTPSTTRLNLKKHLRTLLAVGKSLTVGAVLVALAALLGGYVFRLLDLPELSPVNVMDAVFREPLPAVLVLQGALLAAGSAAWVFFPRHEKGSPSVMGITRFLGAIVGCLLLTALLFLSNDARQSYLGLSTNYTLETLVAQVATAAFVLLLTPIHRKSAAYTRGAVHIKVPTWAEGPLYWLRFLVVSLGIVVFISFLMVASFSESMDFRSLLTRSDLLNRNPLFSLFMTFIAVGIGVGSLFFWPPRFRRLSGIVLLRLLTLVGCLIAVGFAYRSTPYTEILLGGSAVVGVLTFCSIPLQRSLS